MAAAQHDYEGDADDGARRKSADAYRSLEEVLYQLRDYDGARAAHAGRGGGESPPDAKLPPKP